MWFSNIKDMLTNTIGEQILKSKANEGIDFFEETMVNVYDGAAGMVREVSEGARQVTDEEAQHLVSLAQKIQAVVLELKKEETKASLKRASVSMAKVLESAAKTYVERIEG